MPAGRGMSSCSSFTAATSRSSSWIVLLGFRCSGLSFVIPTHASAALTTKPSAPAINFDSEALSPSSTNHAANAIRSRTIGGIRSNAPPNNKPTPVAASLAFAVNSARAMATPLRMSFENWLTASEISSVMVHCRWGAAWVAHRGLCDIPVECPRYSCMSGEGEMPCSGRIQLAVLSGCGPVELCCGAVGLLSKRTTAKPANAVTPRKAVGCRRAKS